MNIKKHIPNAITLLNLVSGVFGIIYTVKGDFVTAFWMMLAAALFDTLDGIAARGLKAYSPLGKELDSLADMVSFGVLPGLMMFYKMKHLMIGPDILTYIPLFIIPCAALRLAKFNLDERQSKGFLGLPTPAAALLMGSLAATVTIFENGPLTALIAKSFIVVPVLTYILCRMMLSELRVISLKSLGAGADNPYGNDGMRNFVFGVPFIAAIAALFSSWSYGISALASMAVLMFFTAFVLVNLIAGIVIKYRS